MESCDNVAETQLPVRDSGNGYKTFIHDSLTVVTAELEHFSAISLTFPMKKTRVSVRRIIIKQAVDTRRNV